MNSKIRLLLSTAVLCLLLSTLAVGLPHFENAGFNEQTSDTEGSGEEENALPAPTPTPPPDGCPGNPEKTEPGLCGCDFSDIDQDGDFTLDCFDGCPLDPSKVLPGICGCSVPEIDSDNDGLLDCIDPCPNGSNSVGAGLCDDLDACPYDAGKDLPGNCGCGVLDQDSDADGTADCLDGCLLDPLKTQAGTCGCGTADTDTDSDGVPDCADPCPIGGNQDGDPECDANDLCPNDPLKTVVGTCGCGIIDSDRDGDQTADCLDGCPDDPNKTAPGVCGCGVSDIDTDLDGTPDCIDGCLSDPGKLSPGQCGCGIPDDKNSNFVPDCQETCDDANVCTEDSGSPLTGCLHTPISCNDGDNCTIDSCDAVSGCIHSAPCNSSQCQSCNAASGSCQSICSGSAPICNGSGACVECLSDSECGDGNDCTDDFCTGGICNHAQKQCNDGSNCTTDFCNPSTGCAYQPVTCNDSNACTADSCDPTFGCTNQPLSCDDFDPCTDDGCDSASGCTHTHNPSLCPICGNGTIEAAEACDDGNLSNGDGCNSQCAKEFCGDGQINNAGAEECDDGNTQAYDGCDQDCKTECTEWEANLAIEYSPEVKRRTYFQEIPNFSQSELRWEIPDSLSSPETPPAESGVESDPEDESAGSTPGNAATPSAVNGPMPFEGPDAPFPIENNIKSDSNHPPFQASEYIATFESPPATWSISAPSDIRFICDTTPDVLVTKTVETMIGEPGGASGAVTSCGPHRVRCSIYGRLAPEGSPVLYPITFTVSLPPEPGSASCCNGKKYVNPKHEEEKTVIQKAVDIAIDRPLKDEVYPGNYIVVPLNDIKIPFDAPDIAHGPAPAPPKVETSWQAFSFREYTDIGMKGYCPGSKACWACVTGEKNVLEASYQNWVWATGEFRLQNDNTGYVFALLKTSCTRSGR